MAKKTIGKGIYHYVGGGTGIPGLPHVVSTDEAAALGLSDELAAAIENGSYTADSVPDSRTTDKSQSDPEKEA